MMRIQYILYFSLISLITYYGCSSKEKGCTDPIAININWDAEEDDGSCIYYGNVSFWTDHDPGCGTITIYINGEGKGKLLKYYPNSKVTNCNFSGCVNLTLEPGTYSYEARGELSKLDEDKCVWTGTFDVREKDCKIILIH